MLSMLLEKDVESFFLEFVMLVYLSFVLIEETWKSGFSCIFSCEKNFKVSSLGISQF